MENMRTYLRPDEVYERLRPLHSHLTESVYEAVEQVNAIRSQGNTEYRKSCIADMLHDHISSQIKFRLDDIAFHDLSVNTINQLFNIKIKDFALITLHKLNRKTLRPPEPKTGQAMIFEKQGDCFNHGEALTNLYYGYTLDPTYSIVTGVYIVLSINGETEWTLDLLNHSSSGLGNIDFPVAPETTPVLLPERRVKVKEGKTKPNRKQITS